MADSRFFRLLRVLQMVPRAPKWTDTDQIKKALQLENDKSAMRTLQRDLVDLERLDFGLECNTSSKPYRWRFLPTANAVLVPGLDPQAALTMRLAELHLERVLPKATMRAIQPHLQAARRALDGKPAARWIDKVRLIPRAQPLLPPKPNHEVVAAVHEALLEGVQLDVRYHAKGSDKVREMNVHPLGLVHRDSLAYLVATARDYDDPLLLSVHRLLSAKKLSAKAKVLKGFDLDTFIAGGELGWRIGKNDIEVKLLFDKEPAAVVEETPLTHDQIMERQADGRVLVKARVPETHVLRSWLLGFGGGVEVLAPKSLRDAVSDGLTKGAARYSQAKVRVDA